LCTRFKQAHESFAAPIQLLTHLYIVRYPVMIRSAKTDNVRTLLGPVVAAVWKNINDQAVSLRVIALTAAASSGSFGNASLMRE